MVGEDNKQVKEIWGESMLGYMKYLVTNKVKVIIKLNDGSIKQGIITGQHHFNLLLFGDVHGKEFISRNSILTFREADQKTKSIK